MKEKFLNIEEELVDFAEVSGFDFQSGRFLANGNLLNNAVMKEKSSVDLLNVVKSVFVKPTKIKEI
ncbi:MAG: hypothetical protein DKM22_02340 [Candidatus Melainabacteria bacterium]|nr:MAG: hypothetical protein DKM22_02340 [Candidatus Melainabacteria bacterium]